MCAGPKRFPLLFSFTHIQRPHTLRVCLRGWPDGPAAPSSCNYPCSWPLTHQRARPNSCKTHSLMAPRKWHFPSFLPSPTRRSACWLAWEMGSPPTEGGCGSLVPGRWSVPSSEVTKCDTNTSPRRLVTHLLQQVDQLWRPRFLITVINVIAGQIVNRGQT
jgi:hypothetical protein